MGMSLRERERRRRDQNDARRGSRRDASARVECARSHGTEEPRNAPVPTKNERTARNAPVPTERKNRAGRARSYGTKEPRGTRPFPRNNERRLALSRPRRLDAPLERAAEQLASWPVARVAQPWSSYHASARCHACVCVVSCVLANQRLFSATRRDRHAPVPSPVVLEASCARSMCSRASCLGDASLSTQLEVVTVTEASLSTHL